MKLQVKFKRAQVQGLHDLIESLRFNEKPVVDDDKLLHASLADIQARLYMMLGKSQSEYTISFPAYQAIALRLLYTDYLCSNPVGYINNFLATLSNNVHQQLQ